MLLKKLSSLIFNVFRLRSNLKIWLTLSIMGILTINTYYFFYHIDILKDFIKTIGLTLLTLGISLPIAIYYQLKQNIDSFKILKTCEIAGIKSIFISREQDKEDLEKAIEEAASRMSWPDEICLLGVAFPTLFEPRASHTKFIEERFKDPNIKMRILLLDPNSDATLRRSELERESQTKEHIESTIYPHIPSFAKERLHKRFRHYNNLLRELKRNDGFGKDKKLNEIGIVMLANVINIELKLYELDPIIFIMDFGDSLFTEQYHLGRPAGKVMAGGSIGRRVPVVQYKKHSDAYIFFKSHFEYMWINSYNICNQLYCDAFNLYGKDQ